MHLAQDNYVVHTLTPDRSDQPFGKAILPGRGWCSRLFASHPSVEAPRQAMETLSPLAMMQASRLLPTESLRASTDNTPPTIWCWLTWLDWIPRNSCSMDKAPPIDKPETFGLF
jgi:hypothetical protein